MENEIGLFIEIAQSYGIEVAIVAVIAILIKTRLKKGKKND